MTISKAKEYSSKEVKSALFNVIRENLDVKTIPGNLETLFNKSYGEITIGCNANLLPKTSISPTSCGNMGLLFEEVELEIDYAVVNLPKMDDNGDYVMEDGKFLKIPTLAVRISFSYSIKDGGTNGASRTFKVAL